MKEIIRKLKINQTKSEEILWNVLRNRKFFNLKFRRQHLTCGKVLDFYCHELKLAIEVDGSIHLIKDQIQKDCARQKKLEANDIKFYRVYSWEVENDLDSLLKKLEHHIVNFKKF